MTVDPRLEADEVVDDPRQRQLILTAMCLALVAVVASVSGLNVAQQALAGDLEASQSEILWIINGYTLTLAALLMPVGAIGDRWGRKPVLVAGLVTFGAFNAASAFAGTPELLIALRVGAGLGAAMIMPVTLSVITTTFPPEKRARAVGAWAGFAGAGGIIGLFASAAIIDNLTWPWIFSVPIALAVASLALTALVVPHSREHVEAGFDLAGTVLSIIAVGGLVLAIQEGPERGWTDTLTLAALAAGLASLALFIRTELHRDHPLLDVRVFQNWALTAGAVNLFAVFALMFSLFLVMVQFLQAALGYSALKAATGLIPMALLMMPLSVVAPTIAERVGLRRTLAIGMLLLAAGFGLFASLADLEGGYLSALPGLLVLAIGVGLSMSPATTAITNALPVEKQGVASALNDTVREMGGAMGIALLGSVLNAQYRDAIQPVTSRLPAQVAEPVDSGIGGAIAVADGAGPAADRLLDAARAAFMDGLAWSMWLGAALAIATAMFTILRAPSDGDDTSETN